MKDALLDFRRTIALLRAALTYGVLPLLLGPFRPPVLRTPLGVRLRLALEELGMTYLKLGQFLAMRYDILPPAVADELGRLFESISPAPFENVQAMVESELGGPLEQFFTSFNREATAAASVAQVHEARTQAGDRVAVKVQRAGIRPLFDADMRNLRRLATVCDALGLAGRISMGAIIDEFATWTVREMDFLTEGTTADRLREHALPYEYVPRIYWELSSSKVLTMEFVDGVSMVELGRLFEAGGIEAIRTRLPNADLALALRRFAFASMHQLFVTGFFHGDPHPGNILMRDDNTVVFLDFGIFGDLGPFERAMLHRFVEALSLGNIEESLRHYLKLIYPSAESDVRACRAELVVLLRRWHTASTDPSAAVEDVHLGKLTFDFLEIVRQHGYRLSRTTMLFWRALIALDATALQFGGYFDLLSTMRSFFQEQDPGLVSRIYAAHADLDRALALGRLARDHSEEISRTLDGLTAEREWSIELDEGPYLQRAGARQARSVSLALVGLSLLILGAASPFEAVLRALLLALSMPVLIWSAAEAGGS